LCKHVVVQMDQKNVKSNLFFQKDILFVHKFLLMQIR